MAVKFGLKSEKTNNVEDAQIYLWYHGSLEKYYFGCHFSQSKKHSKKSEYLKINKNAMGMLYRSLLNKQVKKRRKQKCGLSIKCDTDYSLKWNSEEAMENSSLVKCLSWFDNPSVIFIASDLTSITSKSKN